MPISFTFSTPVPKITRPGAGRPSIAWEVELHPLRTRHEGKMALTFQYEVGDNDVEKVKAKARAKVAQVQKRLNVVAENERWTFRVGMVPEKNVVGVWVGYFGTMTDDEVKAKREMSKKRGEAIKAAKAKKAA